MVTESNKHTSDLSKLPKIDLHRHLEGSLRLSTLVEIIRIEGIDLPGDEASLRKIVQINPEDPWTASNFLSKFKPLRAIYRSPEIIHRVVYEAILDAAADGICYLELQFTPQALSQSQDFALDDVMDWVMGAASEATKQAGLGLGLIPSVNRHESIPVAEHVAQLAIDRMDRGIVGLGLSGNEVEFPAEPFVSIFQAAKEAGLKLTIHAGEWTGANTVRHALERMDADRIGHGIRVMENKDVVAMARERRTVFEVCLSSNLHSGVVPRLQDHPLPGMIEAGLQVTLNTDDPGISNIRLTDDYKLATEVLGLSKTTLKALILVAAQGAFLKDREKRELELSLHKEFFNKG